MLIGHRLLFSVLQNQKRTENLASGLPLLAKISRFMFHCSQGRLRDVLFKNNTASFDLFFKKRKKKTKTKTKIFKNSV